MELFWPMIMSNEKWMAVLSLWIALSIVLGAFGSHVLKDKLTPELFNIFEIAVRYHMFSGLSCLGILLAIKAWAVTSKTLFVALLLQFVGGFFFCGSLYVLVATGVKVLGAVTPIGGTLMILSWLTVSYHFFRS